MGALFTEGVMNEVEELYEYEALRAISVPTMFVVRTERPVVVLGSMQDRELLVDDVEYEVRRRRGGGGMVLLQPDDLWVDWWIPADDDRWRADVHQSSEMVGQWWQRALEDSGLETQLHSGGVEGDESLRVLCFAGRGPGELFFEDRKLVGVTQWRVREGVFLSTVLHQESSDYLADALRERSPLTREAIQHHTARSVGLKEGESTIAFLREISGPWTFRQLLLTA
jgi:lipoate-protein ligase A